MVPALTSIITGLALAFSAPAMASTDSDIQRSLAVAEHVFPNVCHGMTPTLSTERLPERINAYAYTGPSTCRVELSSEWPSWSAAKVCTILLHERGHLAGLDHAKNPASVMFPYYLEPDRRCANNSPKVPPPRRGERENLGDPGPRS